MPEHNPESPQSLRDLVHQSLVSDKLAPSAELRSALEQRLEDEERLDSDALVSPAPPKAAKTSKSARRVVRSWQLALLLSAALVVMVYFSLPEQWKFVASNDWRPG